MKKSLFLILCVLFSSCPAGAQKKASSLYSPSAAILLSQEAMDIYQADRTNPAALEQAMTLLQAALSLNEKSNLAWENLLIIGSGGRISAEDYSAEIGLALRHYVNERSNLAIADNAVAYLIDNLNTRPEREELLLKLVGYFQEKNQPFTSALTTYLGLLRIESGDLATARDFLLGALRLDPYNRQAFADFLEMDSHAEQAPDPAPIALQFRRFMTANPYDLNAAVIFANYLHDHTVYDLAAEAYAYCADLYHYLEGQKPLPSDIYRPWLFCCLRSEKKVNECHAIAQQVRSSGQFDLLVEAVAGAAAMKLDRQTDAAKIWQQAASKAEQRLKTRSVSQDIVRRQLAWFYSFVWKQPEKALAWAHEVYSDDAENQEAVSLFAYALTMNGQYELADEYLSKTETGNPVALTARAMVLHQADKTGQATELLKQVAANGPDTFIGFNAVQLLRKWESDYFPRVPPETIANPLIEQYGEPILPAVTDPDRLIHPEISFNGTQALYGSELDARLIFENIGSQELIIRDHAMFTGWIRVDAEVRGDLNVSIPRLLEVRLIPGQPIKPGQYATVQKNLLTGKLREMLLAYPQADVEVEFTMWMDRIILPDGSIQNRLKGLEPVHCTIHRVRTEINDEYLIQRLEILKAGTEGQKASVARLFAGLLAEQNRGPTLPYKYMKVESTVLFDALKRLVKDEDWKVQLHTLIAIAEVNIPIDSNLISAISNQLESPHWPIRLFAMIVLDRFDSKNFRPVLKWRAQHDEFPINQRMARALMEQRSD